MKSKRSFQRTSNRLGAALPGQAFNSLVYWNQAEIERMEERSAVGYAGRGKRHVIPLLELKPVQGSIDRPSKDDRFWRNLRLQPKSLLTLRARSQGRS
jgi:hypothetical protein